MSVLARGSKRKLNDLDGFEDQRRHRSHTSHAGTITNIIQKAYVANSGGRMNAADPGRNVHPQYVKQAVVLDEPQAFYSPLSESASRHPSPTPLGSTLRTSRLFDHNASIVLIGIRGTGKSSLAVILSTALGRRLIDADRYFEQVTGLSRGAFKKEHSIAEYRQEEARIMELMLAEHREGCVIACGPGSMERSGQQLLKEYAKTHPVVHIIRDAASIQAYLKAWDTEKISRFLEISGPLYRACSNLEFFNVSETGSEVHQSRGGTDNPFLEPESDPRHQAPVPSLTLKRVERDFLRFIAFATGNNEYLRRLQAAFPLSLLPIESRSFTYAVSVPLSVLWERDMDIEDLESTTDAFELRVDIPGGPSSSFGLDSALADRISQTVATIRRNIVVPIIYHVDPGGLPSASSNNPVAIRRSDDDYLNLVEHGLRLAPELLTVDLSYSDSVLSRIIAAKGSTRIVGHFSATQPSPSSWDDAEYMAKYERAIRLGCDFVRLSQPAATIEDNFAVQRFRHRINTLPDPHPPIIAYNTGPLGRLSCCFNPILTPVTHPAIASEAQQKRIPCITARQAQEALFASFTLDPMRFYVFGANVTYSLSPTMHNAAYRACGMPHEYRIHQAPSLRDINKLVEDPHFGGASFSLPYKTEVIPLLHSMSPHARAIGAVNTVIPIRTLQKDGSIPPSSDLLLEKNRAGPVKALHGDNTDWIGICSCIRRGLSPANAVRPSSTGLVIGAGGMARAAIYSMIHLGVQNIFIYNRTAAHAHKMADHYNRQEKHGNNTGLEMGRATVHVIESLQDPWPAKYKQPTIIVSCIPAHSIGGQPAPNFEMPTQWLESPTGGVVVEVRSTKTSFHAT